MEIIKHGDGFVDIMPKVTLTFGAADTAKSDTISCYDCRIAHTYFVVVTIPNWTTAPAPTLTFQIKDPAGNVLYEQAGLVESSTNIYNVERPLIDGTTFVCTLTGVPGGTGGDVVITGSLVNVG